MRIASHRELKHLDLAIRGAENISAAGELTIARQLRSEAPNADVTCGCGRVVDDHEDRIGCRPREVPLQRDEPGASTRTGPGSVDTPFEPTLSPSTGTANARRRAVDHDRTEGRPTEDAFDNRTPEFPFRVRALDRRTAEANGMRSRLIRSPRRPRSAGRSVNAATTETTPTRIAPSARLRITLFGTMNVPHIADNERRPAHEHGAARGRTRPQIESNCSRPTSVLLCNARRRTADSGSSECQPHAGEHVDDGRRRKVERLGQRGNQPERDDDRDDRHQQRNEARDDRQERGCRDGVGASRNTELKLAGLQSGCCESSLKSLSIVDLPVTATAKVQGSGSLFGDVFRAASSVSADEERDQHRVPVARDLRLVVRDVVHARVRRRRRRTAVGDELGDEGAVLSVRRPCQRGELDERTRSLRRAGWDQAESPARWTPPRVATRGCWSGGLVGR